MNFFHHKHLLQDGVQGFGYHNQLSEGLARREWRCTYYKKKGYCGGPKPPLKPKKAPLKVQDYNIIKDDTCMQITPIDKDCGRNPEWNFPMKFYVNTFASQQNRLNLVVELKADKKLGNKDIGEVQVPMKELLESFGESNNEKSESYSVITPSGDAKGLLYFTYKFS